MVITLRQISRIVYFVLADNLEVKLATVCTLSLTSCFLTYKLTNYWKELHMLQQTFN